MTCSFKLICPIAYTLPVSAKGHTLMRYRITPTIVALDVDGILISSPLAKAASSGYISKLLAQTPTLKKIALEILEMSEVVFKARHEMNDRMEKVCCNWDIPYMGIITDRSLHGLVTALRGKDHILARMSFVQVRKTIFGNGKKLCHGPELWETKSVKPDESVLYRLAEFAKSKDVPPHEVLVMDDDPEFRFIAKSRFGFIVYPDDTEDIEVREKYPFFRQRTITPA